MDCIKCESKRIKEFGKGTFFLAFLGTGSIFLFFGLFIWPLLFIAASTLILSPIAFFMPRVYQCQDCKKSFTKKDFKKVV